MATSIHAKSEFRRNNNIRVGYGEVPANDIGGVTCWGFPGGLITFSEEEAIAMATRLDKEIRENMRNPQQLLKTG